MSPIVERFLTWARTAPLARRQEAAHALARAFLHSPMTDEERTEVEATLTVLLDDSAMEVRLALADALARSEKAPHHLVVALAGDKTPIAALVAEHSPLILDSELVDMLGTRDEIIQIAIASRPFVSRAVSAALAEVGTAAACEALLMNPGARVLRFSLDRIVARHGDCPQLRFALLERDDLPPEIRQGLLFRLSNQLRELIVEHQWLAPAQAESVVRDARESATIATAFEAPAESMQFLVRGLMHAKALTPAFLIRAVAAGQTLLFEESLAALAGIPHHRVASLVASGRAANFRALLESAGLPPRTYPAFSAAVEVIRTEDHSAGPDRDYRRASALLDAILSHYQRKPDRELDVILALLRRYSVHAKRTAAREFAQEMLEAA